MQGCVKRKFTQLMFIVFSLILLNFSNGWWVQIIVLFWFPMLVSALWYTTSDCKRRFYSPAIMENWKYHCFSIWLEQNTLAGECSVWPWLPGGASPCHLQESDSVRGSPTTQGVFLHQHLLPVQDSPALRSPHVQWGKRWGAKANNSYCHGCCRKDISVGS